MKSERIPRTHGEINFYLSHSNPVSDSKQEATLISHSPPLPDQTYGTNARANKQERSQTEAATRRPRPWETHGTPFAGAWDLS